MTSCEVASIYIRNKLSNMLPEKIIIRRKLLLLKDPSKLFVDILPTSILGSLLSY